MPTLKTAAALTTALATVLAAGLTMLPAGAPAVAQTPASSAPVGAFELDAVHSAVVYRVKHMDVAYFYGTFDKMEGAFSIDPANLDATNVTIKIDAESVDSNNKGRDDHLKGPDFFSVKEFPDITFTSTKATKTGADTFDLAGNLTFRGVTKPITAKGTFTGKGAGRRGGEIAGLEAKFTIKRSDFGNNYMVGKGLSDEVDLIVSLEGARK